MYGSNLFQVDVTESNSLLVFILSCFCGVNVSNSESNSHLGHIYYFISVSSMYESNLFQVDVKVILFWFLYYLFLWKMLVTLKVTFGSYHGYFHFYI